MSTSDPRALVQPRPPWRRRDHRRERCGVCGVPAQFVVTSTVAMQSPTLTLPATLVALACDEHTDRVSAGFSSVMSNSREELLYETWGFRWRLLVEDIAVPFVWMARMTVRGWRTLVPSARTRDGVIRADVAGAMAALERLESTRTSAPGPIDAPTLRLAPPLMPDSTASPSASKP